MSRQTRLRRAVPLVVLLVLIPAFFTFTAQAPQSTPTSSQDTDLILENRQQGRTIQALYQVEAQAAREGWTAALARSAGDLARELGDMSNAVAYWEIALSMQPQDATLLRQIAQANIDLQRWAEAADTLERLVEAAPDEAWGHYQLGLLRAPIDPTSAIEHLQIAASSSSFVEVSLALRNLLQNNPSDTLLSMRVGLLFMDNQLWSHAELAFSQTAAAAFGPLLAEAIAYTGLARDNQGKDGSSWITQAVTLAPENARVRYVQGLHLRIVRDNRGSLEVLLQAVSLEPDNPAYCVELSTAYHLVDDLPNAVLWLEQALILSNNAPEFQRLLALFYAEEAITLTALGFDVQGELSNLTPDDPDVLAELGWSLYTVGDAIGAQNQFTAALAIDAQNPRALYYRALIFVADGKDFAAVPLLQIVAASDSEFAAEAQRILTSLGY